MKRVNRNIKDTFNKFLPIFLYHVLTATLHKETIITKHQNIVDQSKRLHVLKFSIFFPYLHAIFQDGKPQNLKSSGAMEHLGNFHRIFVPIIWKEQQGIWYSPNFYPMWFTLIRFTLS